MIRNVHTEKIEPKTALWEYEIQEVLGKNLERKGRDEVNALLLDGWIVLTIYTLRYKDSEDTWFERPMVILGLPKNPLKIKKKEKKRKYPEAVIL